MSRSPDGSKTPDTTTTLMVGPSDGFVRLGVGPPERAHAATRSRNGRVSKYRLVSVIRCRSMP